MSQPRAIKLGLSQLRSARLGEHLTSSGSQLYGAYAVTSRSRTERWSISGTVHQSPMGSALPRVRSGGMSFQ